MRSWILTGLGGLLAVMLWRVAQGISTRERMTADESRGGLGEDPKVTKLTELVEDARKRIASLEDDLKKKKTQADQANAAADQLKQLAQ